MVGDAIKDGTSGVWTRRLTKMMSHLAVGFALSTLAIRAVVINDKMADQQAALCECLIPFTLLGPRGAGGSGKDTFALVAWRPGNQRSWACVLCGNMLAWSAGCYLPFSVRITGLQRGL